MFYLKISKAIVIFLICCLFLYCSTPIKLCRGQYKIIDYIFPPKIDSLLSLYLSQYNDRYINEHAVLYLAYSHDTTLICVNFTFENFQKSNFNYTKVTVFAYDTNNKLFDSTGYYYWVKNQEEFLAYNSKRKAIINKGIYQIPILFETDVIFAGMGALTFPLTHNFVLREFSFCVSFTGYNPIKMSYLEDIDSVPIIWHSLSLEKRNNSFYKPK